MQNTKPKSNDLELLRNCELLRQLSEEQLERLLPQLKRVSYRSGQVIFLKNDTADGLYIVIGGRVKINALNSEGKELTVKICGIGEVFGEMALFDGSSRSMAAEAAGNLEAFLLKATVFESLLLEAPLVALNIIKMLTARLRHTDEQVEMLGLFDAYDRVALKLLQLTDTNRLTPQSTVTLSQQDLASMVGLSREWLNKVLQTLVHQGIVELGRSKIMVLNPGALKASLRCA